MRRIREIPPWEWGGEFLELEPQVLRFLGTFTKRYPECAAFRTAHTLASALAVYHLDSRKPKALTEQERADCIAANRNLVDEYSDAGMPRSGDNGCRVARESKASAEPTPRLRQDVSTDQERVQGLRLAFQPERNSPAPAISRPAT